MVGKGKAVNQDRPVGPEYPRERLGHGLLAHGGEAVEVDNCTRERDRPVDLRHPALAVAFLSSRTRVLDVVATVCRSVRLAGSTTVLAMWLPEDRTGLWNRRWGSSCRATKDVVSGGQTILGSLPEPRKGCEALRERGTGDPSGVVLCVVCRVCVVCLCVWFG